MNFKRICSFLLLAPLSLSQVYASENMDQKIINGSKSNSDSWPFMVALVSKNRDAYNGQFCGASFLGGRYILTAAHCVSQKSAQDLDAVIGISDLSHADVEQQRYGVKEIYVHENYIDVSDGNDIAIVELDRELSYTSVNLADANLRHNLSDGEMLTVMGWGDQDPDPDASRFRSALYQVDIPLVKQSLCPGSVASTDNAFCAGFVSGGYDSCQGDSGGPIVVASGNGYEQLGIVSWGYGCAEAGNYGVYANVGYYSDWISAKTQGFSYRQSEFTGIKSLSRYTHTFNIENNTDQVIRTFSAALQEDSASIVANNCSVLAVNASCAITVSYNVTELDFGKVSLSMLTDHAQTPRVDMTLSYIGVEAASNSMRNTITVSNSGVYSSTNSWVNNSGAITTPVLSNSEFSQLAITGLAAGSLSFDLDVSTEKNYDYFTIYVNGYVYDRLSGIGSGKYKVGLPRDTNTVIFEYKKDSGVSSGQDRVKIMDLIHSDGEESARPDGHGTEKSSGSGGSMNWLTLFCLSILVLARKRLV